MRCGYHCHEVGGPYIAENPDCPVHGYQAQAEADRREELRDRLRQAVAEAQTMDEVKAVINDVLDLL